MSFYFIDVREFLEEARPRLPHLGYARHTTLVKGFTVTDELDHLFVRIFPRIHASGFRFSIVVVL